MDAEVLQGKELSYNNWMDADAAWRVMSDVANMYPEKKIVSIIKHANPCGLSVSENLYDFLSEAWMGDAVSSFGGIIALSGNVEKDCAEFLNERFIEVVIAPEKRPKCLACIKRVIMTWRVFRSVK